MPIPADTGVRREDQGLDDDRNGARRVEDGADVDIVEIVKLKAVDRDDRIAEFHFFATMNPDQPADIAIACKDDRMAMREDRSQSLRHPAAEIVEALKCRRTAPGHEQGDRTFATAEFKALERRLYRS